MPIGLGLASSHGGPGFLNSAEEFEQSYNRTKRTNPPPQAVLETPDVLESWIGRREHAFATLRERLKSYRADLLIMIGGDQTEMFDVSNVPNIMIFLGESAWGYNTPPQKTMAQRAEARRPDYEEEDLIRLKVDLKTSEMLLHKLVSEEGFDVAFSREQENLGRPGMGLPHAFHRPTPKLMPNFDVPVVVIYENTYSPPALSAERCYEFGRTLARLLKNDPRRIAIYGSGGLSHAGWPASGWVDEKLDRWVLKQLADGNGKATASLYGFDGKNMRGGTGEIRSWVTVSGAMEEAGAHATVLDYIPAAHAVHGIAWAYWEPTAASVRARAAAAS